MTDIGPSSSSFVWWTVLFPRNLFVPRRRLDVRPSCQENDGEKRERETGHNTRYRREHVMMMYIIFQTGRRARDREQKKQTGLSFFFLFNTTSLSFSLCSAASDKRWKLAVFREWLFPRRFFPSVLQQQQRSCVVYIPVLACLLFSVYN